MTTIEYIFANAGFLPEDLQGTRRWQEGSRVRRAQEAGAQHCRVQEEGVEPLSRYRETSSHHNGLEAKTPGHCVRNLVALFPPYLRARFVALHLHPLSYTRYPLPHLAPTCSVLLPDTLSPVTLYLMLCSRSTRFHPLASHPTLRGRRFRGLLPPSLRVDSPLLCTRSPRASCRARSVSAALSPAANVEHCQ